MTLSDANRGTLAHKWGILTALNVRSKKGLTNAKVQIGKFNRNKISDFVPMVTDIATRCRECKEKLVVLDWMVLLGPR